MRRYSGIVTCSYRRQCPCYPQHQTRCGTSLRDVNSYLMRSHPRVIPCSLPPPSSYGMSCLDISIMYGTCRNTHPIRLRTLTPSFHVICTPTHFHYTYPYFLPPYHPLSPAFVSTDPALINLFISDAASAQISAPHVRTTSQKRLNTLLCNALHMGNYAFNCFLILPTY